MRFWKSFTQPLQHCEDAVMYLLKVLNVRVTASTLKKDLQEHPNYPSLLAISEVIRTYGIHNVAVKLNRENWENSIIPPFLVHTIGNTLEHPVFSVVTSFSSSGTTMYNPATRKVEQLSNEAFLKNHYNDTILYVKPSINAGEKKYKQNNSAEKRVNILTGITALFLPVVTLISFFVYFSDQGVNVNTITTVGFTVFAFLGAVVTTLLTWYELDEYNPVIKQICQTTKTINCTAILNSKASKVCGFSWNSIGLSYFVGTLLALVLGGFYLRPVITLLAWFNMLALPYVIFSVTYQWKVAKQWCIMCLLVQGILLIQFAIAMLGGFYTMISLKEIGFATYVNVAFPISFSFIIITAITTLLKRSKGFKLKSIELQRLKRNPVIFESLLNSQKTIKQTTVGLGINFGNPRGKYKIIKVCNPYCSPCARAHPLLEEIIASNDEISLQVIFSVSNNKDDYKRRPALHLLAIDAMGNTELTKQAFNSWYNLPKKDYQTFANHYPVKGDMERFEEKIGAMYAWCKQNDIKHTPTFFINGFEMPGEYTITELGNILMSNHIN